MGTEKDKTIDTTVPGYSPLDFSREAYRIFDAKVDSMFKPMDSSFIWLLMVAVLGLGAFMGVVIGLGMAMAFF